MLNLVLSHEAYFGLDFCFIYNLLELLSIIRHHTCHSVVVHNKKKWSNYLLTFIFATLERGVHLFCESDSVYYSATNEQTAKK